MQETLYESYSLLATHSMYLAVPMCRLFIRVTAYQVLSTKIWPKAGGTLLPYDQREERNAGTSRWSSKCTWDVRQYGMDWCLGRGTHGRGLPLFAQWQIPGCARGISRAATQETLGSQRQFLCCCSANTRSLMNWKEPELANITVLRFGNTFRSFLPIIARNP